MCDQSTQLSDEELDRRWRACGDEGAFATLDARYRVRLLGFAFRQLSRFRVSQAAEVAADCTQETFLAFSRLKECDPFLKCGIKTVLFTILQRRVRDVLRRARRSVAPLDVALLTGSTADDPAGAIPNEEEREIQSTRARYCLSRLPIRQWVCLVLRYFADLSPSQISDELGQKTTEVNNLLHRARQNYGTCMRPGTQDAAR